MYIHKRSASVSYTMGAQVPCRLHKYIHTSIRNTYSRSTSAIKYGLQVPDRQQGVDSLTNRRKSAR